MFRYRTSELTNVIVNSIRSVFSGRVTESGAPGAAMSVSTKAASGLGPVVDVQKYNRSIHVLAMLLVGFGFLMVFVWSLKY